MEEQRATCFPSAGMVLGVALTGKLAIVLGSFFEAPFARSALPMVMLLLGYRCLKDVPDSTLVVATQAAIRPLVATGFRWSTQSWWNREETPRWRTEPRPRRARWKRCPPPVVVPSLPGVAVVHPPCRCHRPRCQRRSRFFAATRVVRSSIDEKIVADGPSSRPGPDSVMFSERCSVQTPCKRFPACCNSSSKAWWLSSFLACVFTRRSRFSWADDQFVDL